MTKKQTRYMTCCVCGQSAGRWQQHWNRDTGFGVCKRCADEEAKRLDLDEHVSYYGRAGVNYEGEPPRAK